MGSIEVYDYGRQEWTPYVPDYDKWYQHFKDLRDGYVQPDHMGRFIVGSGAKHRKMKEEEERMKQTPAVNLVTPVAQAVEMAKSEVRRGKTRKNGQMPKKGSGKKRKKALITPQSLKRLKRDTYQVDTQV